MSHLVLSKDKLCLKKNDKNIYIGPWEMPELIRDYFSEYELIIPNWHWDNLSKLHSDSEKIRSLYKELIVKFGEALNEVHDLTWSTKEWQILVGPWFKRFLNIIYERHETIKDIYNLYNLKSCTTTGYSINDLHFKDCNDFSQGSNEDEFQQILYAYILKKLDTENQIKFDEVKIPKRQIFEKKENKKKTKKFNLKEIIKYFIFSKNVNFLFSYFIKKNNYYIQSIYLKDRLELLKLNLKLKNFPYLRLLDIDNDEVLDQDKFNKVLRINLIKIIKRKFSKHNNNFFIELIIDFLHHMLPRCYLENLKENIKKSEEIYRHFKPKTIIDSVSYHKDELFKLWLVSRVQANSELILMQHGGNYEDCKISEFIGHELDIADKYLSWGWKKPGYNIVSIPCQIYFNLQNKKKFIKPSINLVLKPIKQFITHVSTTSNPHKQAEIYINDIIKIANTVSKDFALKVFLHPANQRDLQNEIGFQMKTYLQKKITHNNFQFFNGGLIEQIDYKDLNIFTYLGTPYNQAMAANIPSLLYNNENLNPLNENYRFLFDLMTRNNLIHNDLKKLLDHLDNVNYSLSNWWNSKEVINSRNIFCDKFATRFYTTEKLKEAITK